MRRLFAPASLLLEVRALGACQWDMTESATQSFITPSAAECGVIPEANFTGSQQFKINILVSFQALRAKSPYPPFAPLFQLDRSQLLRPILASKNTLEVRANLSSPQGVRSVDGRILDNRIFARLPTNASTALGRPFSSAGMAQPVEGLKTGKTLSCHVGSVPARHRAIGFVFSELRKGHSGVRPVGFVFSEPVSAPTDWLRSAKRSLHLSARRARPLDITGHWVRIFTSASGPWSLFDQLGSFFQHGRPNGLAS